MNKNMEIGDLYYTPEYTLLAFSRNMDISVVSSVACRVTRILINASDRLSDRDQFKKVIYIAGH